MVAHQRLIRERLAETEAGEGLFGAYWEDIDRSIGNAVVREIDRRTAEGLIVRYEWLGCMPAVAYHCFGIYYDEVLAGVAVYGPEYSENLGAIARERGIACADWRPHQQQWEFEDDPDLPCSLCVNWEERGDPWMGGRARPIWPDGSPVRRLYRRVHPDHKGIAD